MKKKLSVSFLFIVSIMIFISSCSKTKGIPEGINYFDTTVNMNFIIQVQNATYWHHVNISSLIYQDGINRGSDFRDVDGSKIIFSPQGDTSHISICSDTLNYNLPIKLSRTKPADILIVLKNPQLGGGLGTYQDIVFRYDPSSKIITSKIFPIGTNPFQQGSAPTIDTTLGPSTGYNLTCKPGCWVIYFKCI